MGGDIEIGGRRIPVWVIAAGVLGALGLFILTRITGGSKGNAGEAEGDLDAANLSDQFQKAINQTNAALIANNQQIQKQIDALTAANAKTNTDLTAALAKAVSDIMGKISGGLGGGNPTGGTSSNVTYSPEVGAITPGSHTGGRTPGPDEKWVGIPDTIPQGVTLTKLASGAIDVVYGNYSATVRPSPGGGYATSMPQYYGPTSSYPTEFKQAIQAAIHILNPGFIGSYWD